MSVDCSRYVKVPDDTDNDAVSNSSSHKSSDSSLNVSGLIDMEIRHRLLLVLDLVPIA